MTTTDRRELSNYPANTLADDLSSAYTVLNEVRATVERAQHDDAERSYRETADWYKQI